MQVFQRFLDDYDGRTGFRGLKDALQDYEPHPDGVETYDIRVATSSDTLITFEIQESKDFRRYGDLRLDYVSAFTPVTFRCNTLAEFNDAEKAGAVRVEKWGKVVNPGADFLVVEFQNGQPHWQVYHLGALHALLPALGEIGKFRTNVKRGEGWGSAFLAVRENHPILQRTKPTTLAEILALTLGAQDG